MPDTDKIDQDSAHVLSSLSERFRHPSTLEIQQNQWTVCIDHSFRLFGFSLLSPPFLIKNGFFLATKSMQNSIPNPTRSKDGPQRPPKIPLGTLMGHFGLLQELRHSSMGSQSFGEAPILAAPPPPRGEAAKPPGSLLVKD